MSTGGDRACYCYVSINLTCEGRKADIISIGAIDPDGDTFYAELYDYSKKGVDPDVVQNTIMHLIGDDDHFKTITGNHIDVREKFLTWLYDHYQPKDRVIQIVMDKVCWDWPILKEFLLGGGTEFPSWISSYVVDLNTELAKVIVVDKRDIDNVIRGVGNYKNFVPTIIVSKEVERVETAESIGNLDGNIMLAHNSNALKKAMCIRSIHQSIWGFDAGGQTK